MLRELCLMLRLIALIREIEFDLRNRKSNRKIELNCQDYYL